MSKFSGQELLYKNGILARNDYDQFKSGLVDQHLAMQEALYDLKAVLLKINSDPNFDQGIIDSLSHLNIDDNRVYDELNRNFNQIKLFSPASGIALLPEKSSDSDTSNTALQADSPVKLNQVLLQIGDFSGLSINVDVSEVSINQLQIGQSATITAPRFRI